MESETPNSTISQQATGTCHVCGKSFSRQTDVHRHIREKHNSVRGVNPNGSKRSDTTDVNGNNPPEVTPGISYPSARIVSSSWTGYPRVNDTRSRVPSVTYELETNSTGPPAMWLEGVHNRNELAESTISESLRASVTASGSEPRQGGSGKMRVEEDEALPQGAMYLDYSGPEPTAIDQFYASQFRSTPTVNHALSTSQADPNLSQSTNLLPNRHNRTRSKILARSVLEMEDPVDIEDWIHTEDIVDLES